MKQLEGETMDEQAQALLDRLVPELADLQKQAAEAYWQATTTGEERFEQQYSELENSTDKSSQTKNCSHD